MSFISRETVKNMLGMSEADFACELRRGNLLRDNVIIGLVEDLVQNQNRYLGLTVWDPSLVDSDFKRELRRLAKSEAGAPIFFGNFGFFQKNIEFLVMKLLI